MSALHSMGCNVTSNYLNVSSYESKDETPATTNAASAPFSLGPRGTASAEMMTTLARIVFSCRYAVREQALGNRTGVQMSLGLPSSGQTTFSYQPMMALLYSPGRGSGRSGGKSMEAAGYKLRVLGGHVLPGMTLRG